MKGKKERILNLILPLSSIVAILLLWAVAALAVDSEYILPSIGKTFSALMSLLGDGEFYLALLSTLSRSLLAFVVSFILAATLAILASSSVIAERIISPFIAVTRALPTIAVVLLLLFWTNSKVAPVIVTMLVVLPTLYTNVKNALDTVDKTTVEAGMVDGANEKQGFTKIRLPQALPSIYSAMGGGLSLNLKLMVAAEVLAATANSLGYLLNTSKVYFEIATMLALVVITVIIGCAIESVFNALSKKAAE
jgi:NitT/TauT family transport system permease protein